MFGQRFILALALKIAASQNEGKFSYVINFARSRHARCAAILRGLMHNRLICVPITETDRESFLVAVQTANAQADAIELRLDYLPASDYGFVLERLAAWQASGTLTQPLVLTHRPQEQGGQRAISFDERLAFWRDFAAWDLIAYADIEFDLVEHLANAKLPIRWEQVICSWHNFDETPATLVKQFAAMTAMPAAVIKVATKCNRIADCLPLFELMRRSEKPCIVLGMGLAGLATRVLCLSRGALLTFAALRAGSESASGQPTVKELAQRYRARELNAASEIYGVMGYPVGHSRSPLMHNAALQSIKRDGVYLPLEVDDAVSFIRDFVHPRTKKLDWHLRGLSVTIPHKLAVMPLLDALDATAQRVGAVNTIVVEGERLIGYNTDVAGAMQPLEAQTELRGARVAVLGAGGAARAVCYGLSERGAVTTVYARDVSKAQTLADEFGASVAALADFKGECDIVINCTPMGMKGYGEGSSPVPAESLRGVKLVYDLVYNPEMTQLLSDAQSAGCATLGGLTMLTTQACEQFRLWTGEVVPVKLMWQAVVR